jgi:hypothetical protein
MMKKWHKEIGPQRDDAEDRRREGKVRWAGSEREIIFYWITWEKWGLNLVRVYDKNWFGEIIESPMHGVF